MVVLLDLDDEVVDPHADPQHSASFGISKHHLQVSVIRGEQVEENGPMMEERANPNINQFSAALGCYPVVSQLAHFLDLNTLHSLSLTCRQFRANILPFRRQLITQTLRCSNESERGFEASRITNSEGPWRFYNDGHVEVGRLTSGRVGRCARDMVGECRRCDRVVCRNCAFKPPSNSTLPNRHRRLCPTCLTCPLSRHLSPANQSSPPTFTALAFLRTPCTCSCSIYLCQSCGITIHSADTQHRRIWTWRTRYSTRNAWGLGTGIGEGIEGPKCGRGSACLAAEDTEVEIDCDAEALAAQERELEASRLAQGYANGERQGPLGYFRQEVEGIGGVVKRKVRKRVKLGKVVDEYEDEREKREILGRERGGENRSWCAWCWRVVPGEKDLVEAGI